MVSRALDSLEIAGYLSIRDASLRLTPLNVLVGPNGSGKSNLVSAFAMLGSIVRGGLGVSVAERGGAASLFHYGPETTDKIALSANFGRNGYHVELGYSPKDELFIASEHGSYLGTGYTTPYTEAIPGGSSESAIAEYRHRPVVYYCYEIISDWSLYHFHDTSRTAGLKRKQPVDDNAYLRSDASNLAPFLLRLKEQSPESYMRIVSAVQLVAPFFQDFVLVPDRRNEDVIQLEWRHSQSDSYFGPSALSDGSIRFICLATLLLQPSPPSVIVVDEPELGLHPFAITQLADLFRAVAAERTQVVVSTQSVTLLNQVDPEDIIVTEQLDGATSFDRLDSRELEAWLEEYAVGELWEKNLLGGRPR